MHTSRKSVVSAFLLLTLFMLAAGGCGYSTPSLIREDIRSVYVPVFDNESFRRGQEKALTAAVIEEIRRNTSLDLAPRESADTVLTGSITQIDEYPVTKTIDDQIVNKRIMLSVKIDWTDRLTGRSIVEPQEVRVTDRFAPSVEASKYEGLYEDAAERIVEKMWAEW